MLYININKICILAGLNLQLMTFLETDRLILRPLTVDDLQGNYPNWLNNQQIVEYNSHGRFPYSLEFLKDYILNCNKNKNSIVLAIEDKESKSHIGNISLQSINWIDRNSEIAFLLGEKEFWGKGIMFEAGQILINHAFMNLNLHRVCCGTSSKNVGMQKLAQKLGMNQEGVRKEAIYKMGLYYDIIEYGILNKKS
jgi:ribosomal-protein-alanine N-acetyltransferase